jgi:hypothetical protein
MRRLSVRSSARFPVLPSLRSCAGRHERSSATGPRTGVAPSGQSPQTCTSPGLETAQGMAFTLPSSQSPGSGRYPLRWSDFVPTWLLCVPGGASRGGEFGDLGVCSWGGLSARPRATSSAAEATLKKPSRFLRTRAGARDPPVPEPSSRCSLARQRRARTWGVRCGTARR